jgi:large subunit ribosomal protein L30
MEKNDNDNKIYAVIRMKSSVKMTRNLVDTFRRLRLKKANNCVIVPSNPTATGMLKKVCEYVTWGEIEQDVLEEMLEKRGKSTAGGSLDSKKAKSAAAKILKGETAGKLDIQPVFRLSPPSKGLRSIRMHYPRGDLGYRGTDVNSLLKRMI